MEKNIQVCKNIQCSWKICPFYTPVRIKRDTLDVWSKDMQCMYLGYVCLWRGLNKPLQPSTAVWVFDIEFVESAVKQK